MKKILTIIPILIISFMFTITVNAEDVYHTVRFNYNGVSETIQVLDGEKVTPIEMPKREGYVFYRWRDNKTMEGFNFDNPITEDVTLAAQWKKEERSDLGELAAGNKDQYSITGVNPNEDFGMSSNKFDGNFLGRLDPISIGLFCFGIVLIVLFFIVFKKEKKTTGIKIDNKENKKSTEKIPTNIINTGKCHRCGAEYSEEDNLCPKCGAKIFHS